MMDMLKRIQKNPFISIIPSGSRPEFKAQPNTSCTTGWSAWTDWHHSDLWKPKENVSEEENLKKSRFLKYQILMNSRMTY